MATIRPFRALHYNAAKVGDLAQVIAPPYDVIDAAHRERLHDRSPLNVVRLILNREADPYRAAAATLSAWWRDGIIIRDAAPSLYFYTQNFTLPEGGARERAGLLAAVRLERFGEGCIYPHERTFPRAKADRLRLIEACRTNLSPVFGVFPDDREALAAAAPVARATPWIDLTDEAGDRHRVWRIDSGEAITAVQRALHDTAIFIADGHHRYETAVAYRDERRARGDTDTEAPHNYVLMFLASTHDPGLVISPTHRILQQLPSDAAGWLERLAANFAVEPYPLTAAGERAMWVRIDERAHLGALGLRVADRPELLVVHAHDRRQLDAQLAALHPAIRYLAVTVLDAVVLRQLLRLDCTAAAQAGTLQYTHRTQEALAAVADGGAAAAFLVRPPTMADVQTACLAGQTMPEKSTYFYPKLLSGLVFHPLDEPPQIGG